MNLYGNYEPNHQYTPEAQIWGHRLRVGQAWIEYLLEFLAVLSGYEYSFGRYDDEYTVPKRLGLRRFAFYDEHEKTPDPRDERALHLLKERIEEYIQANGHPADEIIRQLQSLIRSFSVIEQNRSWYAKSLFPVHEEFILWEALRKGSTKTVYQGSLEALSAEDLDTNIQFLARNFFARGGELYYLMLSAGTEANGLRRENISTRLKSLLNGNRSNKILGKIAAIINQAWVDLKASSDPFDHVIKSKPGWLPDKECQLYENFAEDLDNLLNNRLDELECLELVAHLICFHIIIYIYHRAHPCNNQDATIHQSGDCLAKCRSELLIDQPGNDEDRIIRSISANLLKRHEYWQVERVKHFLRNTVQTRISDHSDQDPIDVIERFADDYFGNIHKRTKNEFHKQITDLRQYATKANKQDIMERLVDLTYNVLAINFRDHFIGIHRRLGRSIGLIAPQRGPQPRFVLGDTLLKTLTMVVVPPERSLRFGEFLERLYDRYGIIIGPGEAKQADLINRFAVSEGAFARNRDQFLYRMKYAGLLTQYSDATAMVHRP